MLMKLAVVVMENEAVTLPLLPPVLTAIKYRLNMVGDVKEKELPLNSCNPGPPPPSPPPPPASSVIILAVSTGSWKVNTPVSSEPPKSRVPPPTLGGPFAGLFICNNEPATDELSTFVTPSCGRTCQARSQMQTQAQYAPLPHAAARMEQTRCTMASWTAMSQRHSG